MNINISFESVFKILFLVINTRVFVKCNSSKNNKILELIFSDHFCV